MPTENIPINGQLVRRNDANFILVDDGDLGGGYRVVQDIVARGAIPTSQLKVGMLVAMQVPTLTVYQLVALSPPTWLPFSGGGGGGGAQEIWNEIPTGPIDGSNTAFTTALTFVPGTLRVTLNGLRLLDSSGGDYVENPLSDGLVFAEAPRVGDSIIVDYELP